nr:PREDICTED: uncharacterized protein LOC102345931 [Latimeria chalumnae]|eukprot:XP_014343338.1 PREDICTED: uncharacterized protein LOC102345931 [Latimeria chalumnae]
MAEGNLLWILSPSDTPLRTNGPPVRGWRHLRRPLSNRARRRLRAECPRPTVGGDVELTPQVDKEFLTFFAIRSGRDPRKGLDRSLRTVQDKLLDVAGPLARIFELAEDGMDGHKIDPVELCDWVQHCVWFVGNTNAALLTERHRSFLLKLNPQLVDLAQKEFGPEAKGLLFGEPFLLELSKTVRTFASLDRASVALRRSLSSQVFSRAGGNRGPPSGRGSALQTRGPVGNFRGSRSSFRGGRSSRGQGNFSARGRGDSLSGKCSSRTKGPVPYLVQFPASARSHP